MRKVESVGQILPRVLTKIRDDIIDKDFTPERSIQVDQIDGLLDKWKES